MTWKTFLDAYASCGFDAEFSGRWGGLPWEPGEEDRKAAARLHLQLISRIATQKLGYLDGVEKTALDSIYALFDKTRTICDESPGARHFTEVAWQVLNNKVRPFTAKWHRRSERGLLFALDTTDVFRAELIEVQTVLRRFEDLLRHLRDGQPPPKAVEPGESSHDAALRQEMLRVVAWKIPPTQGGMKAADAEKLNHAEKTAIESRRRHYGLPEKKEHAVALALSGGGIRSATFSLGVMVALARRGLLPQFDYLSTVSGGGYLGSFLTAYLNTPANLSAEIGLRAENLPFLREGGEAEALRHIRHHSKYLATGSVAARLQMVGAQLFGMMLNGSAVILIAGILALIEYKIRIFGWLGQFWKEVTALSVWPAIWKTPPQFVASLLLAWAFFSLLLMRGGRRCQKSADRGWFLLGTALLLVGMWNGLGYCHQSVQWALQNEWTWWSEKTLIASLGALSLLSAAFAGFAGRIFDGTKAVLGLLSVVTAPVFFFGVYLVLYESAGNRWFAPVALVLGVVYVFLLNINFTSPHRHYRNKLAEAYLIQPSANPKPGFPFAEAVDVKLSMIGQSTQRAPYHLINAALNVPATQRGEMQGRLTDFFLFSPALCGSPLTGYAETKEWEAKDQHLDLGTAMAISGAAAAPQMGLGTKRKLSFWLALFNVRLGYWVRNPKKWAWHFGGAPGLWFLVKEMLGSMDEHSPWLYISDGGHIENLGVYELLRRRCQYIVAVDGEQDECMTFAALTTLQRLAAIDLGVKIDINLDDLRLNEHRLSRSHFRFCRIEYPGGQYGYLLYVKLSLTGNEGEFLRRYRLDEPAFPHHSTADQFFSEAQFEAYRSLGVHVGDKLFLPAIVGDVEKHKDGKIEPIEVETWFRRLGHALLEPLPQNLPE